MAVQLNHDRQHKLGVPQLFQMVEKQFEIIVFLAVKQ